MNSSSDYWIRLRHLGGIKWGYFRGKVCNYKTDRIDFWFRYKKLILKRIIKLNEVIRECYYFILFILSLQFMKHVLDFCVIIWTQTSACHRTTNKPYTNGCDNSLWLTSLGMTTFRRSLSYPLIDKIINSWWAYSYFLNQWIILMCRQLFFLLEDKR